MRADMGRRVLIVDDNADSRDALSELLRSWGHEAKVAADGCEGITLALEHRPDVVLLDIRLPDLDGSEVARRIRSGVGNGVRLVALTGSDEEEKAGTFDDYILKPAEPEVLRAAIEKASRATA
jgi:CheY-like chemotaxis protein